MTIRYGELYIVESSSQFKEQLDVDNEEIKSTLTEPQQDELIENENIAREDAEAKPTHATDVSDVHEDTLQFYISEIAGPNHIIKNILDGRGTEYTHVYNNPVHRIIELYPEDNALN
jgi:hypothetical protein